MKWTEKVARIAFSDGFADITRILDKDQKTNPFFLMNIDNDQASTFEKMTFKGADWWLLNRENNTQMKGDALSVQLTGRINSLSPLVVEPLNLNATSNSFLGLSEVTVSGKQKLSSEAKEGDLVVVDGHFESTTTVNANTVSLLNDLPHRIEFRLPIISQTELAEVVAGKLRLTEQGLEESIYRAYYPSSGAVFEDITTSIKSIDFSNASVVVNVGRVDPYTQITSFSTASEASQLIKELLVDGFQINGLKADGDQEGDSFKASKLIVTVFGPSNLDLLVEGAEANLSLSLNGQSVPLLKGIQFALASLKAGAGYNATQNAELVKKHKQASTKAYANAQDESKSPLIDSRKKNLSAGPKKRLGFGKIASFFSSQPKIWRLMDFREKVRTNYGGALYSVNTIEHFKILEKMQNGEGFSKGKKYIANLSLNREAGAVMFIEKYISDIDSAVKKRGAFKVNSRYLNEASKAVTEFGTELERSRKAALANAGQISAEATDAANKRYKAINVRLDDLDTVIRTKINPIGSPDSTMRRRR